MSAADLRKEITELVGVLLEHGLVIDSNAVVVQSNGPDHLVTWTIDPGRAPLVVHGSFGTLAEYRRLLRDRQYTCLLRDGAFLQLSFELHNEQVVKHRLCYYPCPVELLPGDLDSGEALDELVDFFLESEFTFPDADDLWEPVVEGETGGIRRQTRVRLRSPIRFDYDLRAQGPGHPASHVHLTREECRWPVFGPLSIGHFIRFVLRHFYPDACQGAPDLLDWPMSRGPRSVTVDEERELYIEVRG